LNKIATIEMTYFYRRTKEVRIKGSKLTRAVRSN
jgi:hypothetical protein